MNSASGDSHGDFPLRKSSREIFQAQQDDTQRGHAAVVEPSKNQAAFFTPPAVPRGSVSKKYVIRSPTAPRRCPAWRLVVPLQGMSYSYATPLGTHSKP